MKISDTAHEALEKIAIDVVIMKKEKTKRGNQYIITIQEDNLTKFLVLYAVSQHTATYVFRCLLNFIFHYDIPKIILSDNGTEFTGELMELFTNILGIQQIQCTPYHPEGNGAIEGAHGKMQEYLQLFTTAEKRGEWDECLGRATSAYNKTKHSATGFPPHELVFGEKPNIPTEPDLLIPYEELLFGLQDRLHFSRECAQQNIKKKKDATKICYDEKSRTPYIKEGDFISIKKHKQTKSESRYKGPYEVLNTSETGVTVLENGNPTSYHFQNVTPYFARLNTILTSSIMIFLFSLIRANEIVTILYQDIDSLKNVILSSRKNVLHPYIIS